MPVHEETTAEHPEAGARSTGPPEYADGADHLRTIRVDGEHLDVDAAGDLLIEGCSARELVERFGSPLYVVSEATLRGNYRRIRDAFAAAWPRDVRVLYAIKANNNLAIRAILSEEGAGTDCFGDGELYAARLGGTDPDRIVLNGSNKSAAHIAAAVELGCCVNVDAEDEIDVLEELGARDPARRPRVNLRLNVVPPEFDPRRTLAHRQWGFTEETAERLVRRLAASPHVDLVGYHLHIGRTSATPAFHEAWSRRLAEAIVRLARTTGWSPRVLDAGGGYARQRETESRSSYALHDDGGAPPLTLNAHTIQEYAAAVAAGLTGPLRDAGLEIPELWIEPGRYIVGNAELVLARVGNVKHDGGVVWCNVDASINDIMRAEAYGYIYHVIPASRMRAPYEQTVNIVGSLCTGGPLARDRRMPEPRRDDLVAILDAGMYAETMSTQMNGVPRPATVLVDGTRAEVIKERETVGDVFAKHRIPPRLLVGAPR